MKCRTDSAPATCSFSGLIIACMGPKQASRFLPNNIISHVNFIYDYFININFLSTQTARLFNYFYLKRRTCNYFRAPNTIKTLYFLGFDLKRSMSMNIIFKFYIHGGVDNCFKNQILILVERFGF